MSIGLIIIGDELLSGKRQDKHLAHMIDLFRPRGLEPAWVRMVGDEHARLVRTLRESFAWGDAAFCFGGIGATPDDLTRACAAEAAGVSLVRHAEAAQIIERRFGEAAHPNRIRMADLPQGAELIPNPVNEVPGFSLAGHHFLPGFPNMAWPMAEWVLEKHCRHLFRAAPDVERRLQVAGVTESELIPLMEDLLARHASIRLSSLPHTGDRRQIELGLKGGVGEVETAWLDLTEALRQLGIDWTAIDEDQ
ncbi:MAG: molybdopterin-binding protein [Gammaproteobacteria bacterium]|jgi:molybdopterin-biosynthesis enzyme MoeA-like protein